MPPSFEVRDVLRTLEDAAFENKLPIYDDGRMIVDEGRMALKEDMKFATRKYRAPYGLEELEFRQEWKKLDAAGPLYASLTDYTTVDPTTTSPLSVGTPGDKRSLPVENRFRDVVEREQGESGEEESMDEFLSEAGEEMEVGNTPDQGAVERDFTTQGLLQDLSGDDWANTSIPPLGSPRKNLELPLTSETSTMGMLLLSAQESKKNTFKGNKWMFLETLDEKAWREILSELNQKMRREAKL